MPRGIASQPAWRPGTVRRRTLMHEPLGEDAGGECESDRGSRADASGRGSQGDSPRGPSSRRAGLPLMLRERTGENLATSVMITRRFQYPSVSAHRSLACGSRVSQAGWAVAAEHLGLFEVDRVTRGGVHPEYPARRDLLVLPTATFRAATGRDEGRPCSAPPLRHRPCSRSRDRATASARRAERRYV